MNNYKKFAALWIGAIIVLGLLTANFWKSTTFPQSHEIIYSDFLSQVSQGRVAEVSIEGSHLVGTSYDGQQFLTQLPFSTFFNPDLMRALESAKVRIKVIPHSEPSPSLFQIFISSLPALVLIGIAIFFIRQQNSGRSGALGFGRSRIKSLNEQQGERITFADVAGIDEAKEELAEVVDFLKNPHKFQKLGGKIPKGILLMGSPGTGKTLLARAIAGEAGVPFFSVSGSEFVEMFVGVGASRVRDTFTQGKKNAPCIIFIDEIDAVGRHRGAGLGGGNDEREQTLNQLLVEMDGFESNDGVILVGATNRPDVLDPALLRPGRFDREIVVPRPDVTGREKILQVHVSRILINDDVDLKIVARGTPGFSGADLANLVNEAALLAGRHNRKKVSMAEFEEVRDRLIMGGRERRSLLMTEKEKWITCYHEGGHAVVAWHSPHSDPIHKATIIPRGRALGVVMRLPEGDQISSNYARLVADISVAMGGRVAEELVFGKDQVTTGASQDIKTATSIARRMITEWGMSQNLGPLTYGESSQEIFLGHSVTQHKNISEATSEKIDAEIRSLIETCYQNAVTILTHHRDHLNLIAQKLFEHETLSGSDITELLSPELSKALKPKALYRQKKASVATATSPHAPSKTNTNVPDLKKSKRASEKKNVSVVATKKASSSKN